MSEIDVSKCDYYFQGRCGVSENINYSIGCYANDCYYKQLQQLKQENEYIKIKKNKYYIQTLEDEMTISSLINKNMELQQKLEKIKEICNRYKTCIIVLKEDILQIIEGEDNE